MSQAADVSVVIPTYMRAAQTIEAVRTVLAQTRPVSEVIVVDDGSPDGSAARVAEAFADQDRVRLVAQANGGSGAARNRGVQEARAAWVAFLDSDDGWAPDWIEAQMQAAAGSPEADLLHADARYVGPWKREGTRLMERPSWRAPSSLSAMLDGAYGLPSCWMVRRHVALALPFDPAYPMAEDTAFLFAFNAAGHDLVENPAALTHYRHHGASGADGQKVQGYTANQREQIRLLEHYADRAEDPRRVRYQLARRRVRLMARLGQHRSLRPHALAWLRQRPFGRGPWRYLVRSFLRADQPTTQTE